MRPRPAPYTPNIHMQPTPDPPHIDRCSTDFRYRFDRCSITKIFLITASGLRYVMGGPTGDLTLPYPTLPYPTLPYLKPVGQIPALVLSKKELPCIAWSEPWCLGHAVVRQPVYSVYSTNIGCKNACCSTAACISIARALHKHIAGQNGNRKTSKAPSSTFERRCHCMISEFNE